VDRARPLVSRLARRLRAVLSLSAGALVAPACDTLLGDPERVIALELVGGTSRTIAVGDTLQLVARAITAAGDSVPGAPVVWSVLDTGVVGIRLESLTGRVIGEAPDTGRVRASYENLHSDPVKITVVTAAPTSHAPTAPDDAIDGLALQTRREAPRR
jgi:phage tail sheath gpL-like